MSAIIDCGADLENYLQRNVGTDFPVGEFTFTWQVFYDSIRAASFQTPIGLAKSVFVGDQEYIIMCFDGNGGVSNNFAIGSQGNDTYGDEPPVSGQWYRQGFVRRATGGGNYDMDLYINLGVGTEKITRVWSAGVGTFAVVADSWLAFGNAPYTLDTENEGIDGKMRCVKGWSRALSEADIILESASGSVITSAANLYGRWPLVSDADDLSGNGRHMSSPGTVTFDDEPDPGGPEDEVIVRSSQPKARRFMGWTA